MNTLKIVLFTLIGIIVSIISVEIVLVGCGGITKGKLGAENAIVHFHQLYNDGKLDEIWNEATPVFRSSGTRQNYDDLMTAVRRKLGNVSSTTNTGWKINSVNLKTTVVMIQQTLFEKGHGTESFTFGMDGTNAVLAGYDIQSKDLIMK